MKTSYKPEGTNQTLFQSFKSSPSAVYSLIDDNKIYEAPVLKCDANLDLWLDFKGIKCIMPRDEVNYLYPGEKPKDIAVICRVGKSVCFKIIGKTNIGSESVLIISRKLAQEDCIESYINHLRPGDIIDAKITHMEQFGAFCDIGCGIISLLSVDCISVSRISHPSDRFSIGDKIKVVVKSIGENGRIYVSHKELLGTWEENAAKFSPGQTVAGIVRSVEKYGIFVELSPNLAGLAEVKEGIYPSETAAVYIKSIIPERMKIKLVLIDGKCDLDTPKKFEYIGENHQLDHIDYWLYSPSCSEKTIESIFM